MIQSAGRRALYLLTVVAILAAGLILVSTWRGPGVGGDATVYISSARNLNAGLGLGMQNPDGSFQALSYYPPLFPLSLSAIGVFGVDLASGARWLNALLFGLLVWLTGFSLGRASRSPWTGLLAALVLALSPIAIPPFSWAMSEPLANFLGFLGLACLLWQLEQKDGRGLLIVSALLCGLSTITRYASLPFLAAGAIGLFFLTSGQILRRLGRAALYLGIGLVPPAAWEAWDYLHSSSLASRSLEQGGTGLFSSLASFWQSMRQVFLGWFFPDSWLTSFLQNGLLQSLLTLAAIVVLGLWAFFVLRRRTGADEGPLLRLFTLMVIFFVVYTVFILATYLLIFPVIDVSQRIMLPLHIAFIWGVTALAALTLRSPVGLRRAGVVAAVVVALAVAGWFGSRSVRIVQQNYRDGLGYNSTAWQSSSLIAKVRSLPQDTVLISNDPAAIYYLTGRTAYTFAEPRQPAPVSDFYRYGDGSLSNDPAQAAFKDKSAGLVLFASIFDDMQPLYGSRTQERVRALVQGLVTDFSASDGWIYYYPHPAQ